MIPSYMELHAVKRIKLQWKIFLLLDHLYFKLWRTRNRICLAKTNFMFHLTMTFPVICNLATIAGINQGKFRFPIASSESLAEKKSKH